MHRNGFFRNACVGILLMGLFCCVGCVRSLNPVLKDDQVTYDKDLLGEWVGTDNNANSHATIIEGQENQYIILDGKKDEPEKGNYTGQLGKIGDQLVFEITVDPKDIIDSTVDSDFTNLLLPTYSFCLVEKVSANQMKVRILKPDWLKEYLKQHPDELTLQKIGKSEDNQIVTSSTDQWQAFVVKHLKDADAWSDPILYVHPGDPATRPSASDTQPSAASTQPAK